MFKFTFLSVFVQCVPFWPVVKSARQMVLKPTESPHCSVPFEYDSPKYTALRLDSKVSERRCGELMCSGVWRVLWCVFVSKLAREEREK